MGIVLWKQKGIELSPQELDGNFEDLTQRVCLLEGLQTDGHYIKGIILEGDELVFHGQDEVLGRVRMPIPQMHFRGQWCEHQDYTYGDVVRHGMALYFCHTVHTAQPHFDGSLWSLMLDHGLNDDKSPSALNGVSTHTSLAPLQLPTFDKAHLPEPCLAQLIVCLGEGQATLMLGSQERWHKVMDIPL